MGHLLPASDGTHSQAPAALNCCKLVARLGTPVGWPAPLFSGLIPPRSLTLQVGIMRRGRYRKGNKIGKAPSATEVGWRTPAE